MPKIAEALQILWIDKEQFTKIYEEIIGTSLKSKTSIISEKNMEQFKKIITDRGLAKPKTVKIIKKQAAAAPGSKVIKSDQFLEKTDFLSGMGFASDQIVIVEEEETPTDTIVTKKDFEIIKEQVIETRKEKGQQYPNQSRPEQRPNNYQWQNNQPRHGQSGQNRPFTPHAKKIWGSTPTFSQGRPRVEKAPYQASNSDKKPETSHTNHHTHSTHPTNHAHTPNHQHTANNAHVTTLRTPKEATTSQNLIKKNEVTLGVRTSVKEFSEKIGIGLPEVMKVLLKNKIMVWINSSLDFDTATLIWEELWIKIKRKELKLEVESFLSWDLQSILELDKEAEHLEERWPIVTVMGHVDHGKTTLLDYLRKTTIASWEAWGITQSIGASVVNYEWKKITFIDTPGHELFTSLRARGAKLTNVAVIVVAADDSVMPQTIESINHAKAAWVPIIIAVTKIDKQGIHIEQIKNDLAARGITPEDRGGDTPIVGISAHTGQGIPDLLEHILLQAEMLQLTYNPKRSAVGVVLDAYKDPKQGVVTSIIVMTGTMHLRDIAVAYNTYGKIKKMRDRTGKDVGMVRGGEPVQVLWFTEMPEPGRIVEVVKSDKEAMVKVALIQAQNAQEETSGAVEQFLQQLKQKDGAEIPVLRLILKSDGSSSLEALKQAVGGLKLPQNVDVKVIHQDAGPFSDSDLALAQASKALIVWFNLPLQNTTKKNAQSLGVEIKSFDIIYELTDYLNKLLQGMIIIEQEEVSTGKLKVLGIFYKKWKEMVIWWEVIKGRILDKSKFIIHRDDAEDGRWQIESLQQDQHATKEVKETYQCGMKIRTNRKIIEGDILEFFTMQDKV